MKKLSILLTVVFCLCAINKANSQVVDSGTTGDCTWELTGTTGNYTLTISGSGAMDNYTYYSSSPWYSYRSSIKSLNIQQGVTIIGNFAFHNCSGLTSVTIGNSVTTIGSSAFSGCTDLTSVTIPNSVTTIGDYAFYGCRGLTSVNFNATNCTSMGGSSVFTGCSSFSTLTIGNNVQIIPDYAFTYCSGLTSVTIPNLVTTIGERAFYNCTGLTSVIIGSSVTSIGEAAFYLCEGLTSVTIPNSVTYIREKAFYYCTGLTEIHVKAKTPPRIGEDTFYDVPTDIPVYVCGEVDDYRNAYVWWNFTNILPDNNCNIAVEDLEADIINIYPNPATDNIIISLRENITNAAFTLYDMQGRVLIRQAVTNEDVISVSEFAAGIYIYSVNTGKGSVNGKIVVVNN